ncbi:MAG: GNAT family N-acetyltransferase, partial [Gammaproteobacteria bacterium]|nr:GNAT family N-acetyltransferase [Gammaproteobacteria bacterium]
MTVNIEVRLADYNNQQDGQHLVKLLNDYAQDPMGGGESLKEFTQQNLAKTLATVPHAFTVLAFVDGEPAGLVNCFEGFSTFKCRPLINIHDISVSKPFRGLGLSLKMMALVEQEAKKRNACKLTLEVLEGNKIAQAAYEKFGFTGYELDPEMGKAMFWEKP